MKSLVGSSSVWSLFLHCFKRSFLWDLVCTEEYSMIFLLLARLEVSSQVSGRTLQEAESPGKMRNDSCKAFHQVLTENEEGSEDDIIFVYYIYIYIYTIYCLLHISIHTKNKFINFHLQLDPKVGH